MLRLAGVCVSYGKIEALKGINMDVRQGEIVALIGANGAGKSTTLMAISRGIRIKSGKIVYGERDISELPAHEVVRLGISQVPEGRRIFPRMTVRENLEMGAFLSSRREFAAGMGRVFEMFPALAERSGQQGGTLSGGEQQMLAIGRALMSGPKILLLDEPSLGLAPIIVSRIFEIIKDINQQGTTVLLVEQNAKAALRLAHRAYVLAVGRISRSGASHELGDPEELLESYLARDEEETDTPEVRVQ